jgi:hypothetical protein
VNRSGKSLMIGRVICIWLVEQFVNDMWGNLWIISRIMCK